MAGIPLFAGFFSKDEILGKVFAAGYGDLNGFGSVYLALWVLGLAGAFMTAFYMFRVVYMTFHGEFRGTAEQAHHLHESPASMTWPLKVLGVGSIVAGFFGVGAALTFGRDMNWFEHLLQPVAPALEVEHAPSLGIEWGLIALSVAVAVGGILLARRFYFGPEAGVRPKRLAESFPALYAAVANKYYVDEFYDVTAVAGTMNLAKGCWEFDARVVDGAVNGARHLTVGTSFLSGFFDLNVVDGLVNLVARFYGFMSGVLRRVQIGRRAGLRAGDGPGVRADGRRQPCGWAVEGDAMGFCHQPAERRSATCRCSAPWSSSSCSRTIRAGRSRPSPRRSQVSISYSRSRCGSSSTAAGPAFQFTESARVDPLDRRQVPGRRRRHLAAADPADDAARLHRGALLVDRDQRPARRSTTSSCCCCRPACSASSCALDFFLFYVFWEVMLVPMYFLIGIWGGPRKLYAAIKFFLYTLVGSVLMLLGILALYFYNSTGLLGLTGLGNAPTFDILQLPRDRAADPGRPAVLDLPGLLRRLRHQGPDVPVPHLAARRPRRGADGGLGDPGRRPPEDGDLRLHPLLAADAARRDAQGGCRGSSALAIIGIIYGALVAMAQKDMKKLVAYSSV